MEQLEQLRPYIPLLIPILLIQLALVIAALVDLIRREKTKGPKWLWVLIILFINFIGPIIYFVVGRDE
ncbi:MAG: PLDc N-terminal domain-containing protein [Anaerolineae bacterium]|nr:PLDc N-terminal domain-containing protein [Anaerolineae bacterium]